MPGPGGDTWSLGWLGGGRGASLPSTREREPMGECPAKAGVAVGRGGRPRGETVHNTPALGHP